MTPFRVHEGLVLPLLRRDIDTDQIIPKQFLKSIERTGFGRHLFNDWRRRPDGSPDPSFPLNDRRYDGATILVAGDNFGCGSSREHAAWALADYGFRAVIAPSFADIFRSNAVANGLLPVSLPEAAVVQLAARADEHRDYTLRIDLEARQVSDTHGFIEPFALDEAARHRLLHGLDDIGLILEYEDDIARFEAAMRVRGIRPPAPRVPSSPR
ncbi:MAG: 3-isopropylmalate dehydratase small subunit [Acidobacteriota bacterium]